MRGMHTSLVNLVARLTSTVLLVTMPAATGVVGTRVSTAFAEQDAARSDAAPTVYITGNPAQTAGVTRAFERGLVNVTAVNPYSNQSEKVANFVADQAEMRLLHMVTADPARPPTVTMFAKPDYFLFAGARNCNAPCISINPDFNWNHGDVTPEINTTFMGLVGPGVRHLGVDHGVWTDHTDTRPTVLALLGLKDDYRADGRVIFEILRSDATPDGLHQDRAALRRLADAYKQLNAAVGQFGLDSLNVATAAAGSSTPGDARFKQLEAQLTSLTDRRNTVAARSSLSSARPPSPIASPKTPS